MVKRNLFRFVRMSVDAAAELAVELAAEFKSLGAEVVPDDPEELFEALYVNYPTETARVISRTERERNNFKAPALTYGEITFGAFRDLFDRLYAVGLPATGGTFVDIGCGSGRPV